MTIAHDTFSIGTAIPFRRVSLVDRFFGLLTARRQRQKLAGVYADLLAADDHVLRDLGVTRHDVLRLHEDLFAR